MRAWTVFVRNESLDRVQHESLDTTRVRQALGQFIDGAGGVIMRRWGDAPIRTLSLHLLEGELNLKFRQVTVGRERLCSIKGAPIGRFRRELGQGTAGHP